MISFSDAALMPAQRKFDRCASAAALYDQRMKDFDAWCGWPCYDGDLQGKEMRGTAHENSHMKSSGVIRQSQINGKPMPVKIYKSSFFLWITWAFRNLELGETAYLTTWINNQLWCQFEDRTQDGVKQSPNSGMLWTIMACHCRVCLSQAWQCHGGSQKRVWKVWLSRDLSMENRHMNA